MRKPSIISLALALVGIILLLSPGSVYPLDEVTLFDRGGNPTAYIAPDDDGTIYMWDGNPAAYIERDPMEGYDVWGYNGKHLGWFFEGLFYDHNGYVVGFAHGSVNMMTKFEPIKGFKQPRPIRNIKDIPPIKPVLNKIWSRTNLSDFLNGGGI